MGPDPEWYDKTAEEVYGTTTGKPGDAGFLFIDGKYVEAPYVVSQRAGKVYINDTLIRVVAEWPPSDWEDEKPEMPEGLTRMSGFEDLVIKGPKRDALDAKMSRWIHRHHPLEEALAMEMEFYRSLPFVKSVSRDDPFIRIDAWNGDYKILPAGGEPIAPIPTRQQLMKSIEAKRTYYERSLRKGHTFFMFNNCTGIRSFGLQLAERILPTMLRVAREDSTMDAKIAELVKTHSLPKGQETWGELLLRHFLDSPQLAKRIEALWGTENTRPPGWTPPTNPPPSSASVSNAPEVSVQTNGADGSVATNQVTSTRNDGAASSCLKTRVAVFTGIAVLLAAAVLMRKKTKR